MKKFFFINLILFLILLSGVTYGQDRIFSGLDFSDSLNGWVAGESGTIFYTQDGGHTWQSMDLNTSDDFADIYVADGKEVWLVSVPGVIFHTSDHGLTWSYYKSNSPFLTSICFTDKQNGWVCGGGGVILHTSDSGFSWVQQVSGTDKDLSDIIFIDKYTDYLLWGGSK